MTAVSAKAQGKKSVKWHEDPEILLRLDLVSSMMNEGAKPYQIANSLGVDWKTAKRDIERVKELRRMYAAGKHEDKRQDAIAVFRHIIMHAFQQFRTQKHNLKDAGAMFLRIAGEAQRQIVELEGTREPTRLQIDFTFQDERVRDAIEYLEANGVNREDLYKDIEAIILEEAKIMRQESAKLARLDELEKVAK